MDLLKISGIPMQMDADSRLLFDPQLVIEESKERPYDALTGVYLDRQACQGSQAAYYMYNGIFHRQDEQTLGGLPLRYELTLLPDLVIGRERVKTHGHIHASDPVSGIDFPEICEVLVGRAHFLFQKLDLDGPTASEVFYVEVQVGEKIVIPPGYEHLTINPGPGPLLFSDVVVKSLSGVYDHLRSAGGAAYLEIQDGEDTRFIANPGYRWAAPLRAARPLDYAALHLSRAMPLYKAFRDTQGKNWPFLWDPTCFRDKFPGLEDVFRFDGNSS